MWHHVEPFLGALLNATSHISLKRAAMFVSPYLPWVEWRHRRDLIRAWIATASVVPKDEQVAPSIVETLLRIAFLDPASLQSNNGDIWSWLTLRPSLPPICKGRYLGSDLDVVRTVRNLKDMEILKSYLVLVWSEWDPLWHGFPMMCDSLRDDFGGTELYFHRADLMKRLDHVLGQLGRGLEYLQQHRPELDEDDVQKRKDQYGKLREILLEVDRSAFIRRSSGLIVHFNPLTPIYAHRIPLEAHVCAPYPMSVVGCPGHLVLVPPLHTVHTLVWIPAVLLSSNSPSSLSPPAIVMSSSDPLRGSLQLAVGGRRLCICRMVSHFRDLCNATRFSLICLI